MPIGWWARPGSGANKLEGEFQNSACQHQCLCGRRSSQNVCHKCLCPQGQLQFPPASLRGSLRLAGGSDPSFFKITASALGPRVCEVLCAPFKSGVFISHSPPALLKVSPAGLQRQRFWGLVFLDKVLPGVGPLGWGAQCGTWAPLLLGENLYSCNYPPVCGSPTWG